MKPPGKRKGPVVRPGPRITYRQHQRQYQNLETPATPGPILSRHFFRGYELSGMTS